MSRFPSAKTASGITRAPRRGFNIPSTAASLGFPLKAAEELGLGRPPGSDHLDRNDTGGSEVSGEIDVAHTAGAELAVNAVFGVEDLANHGKFRIPGAALRVDADVGAIKFPKSRRRAAWRHSRLRFSASAHSGGS